MRTLASGETDAAVIAQAFRTIPVPGLLAGNMVVLGDNARLPSSTIPLTNCAAAYLTADQTGIATSTFTKITLNSESFDADGVFDSTTNYRFQPTVAGKFLCIWNVTWNASAVNSFALASIFKNGSDTFRGTTAVSPSAGGPGNNVIVIVDMNGTSDYLEGYVWQNTGSNQTVLGGSKFTFFSAYRIGS